MRRCSRCGFIPGRKEARFCGKCGTKLPASEGSPLGQRVLFMVFAIFGCVASIVLVRLVLRSVVAGAKRIAGTSSSPMATITPAVVAGAKRVAGTSASLTSAPWPMFGHDCAHTGRSQFDTSANPGTVWGHYLGIVKWKLAIGGGSGGIDEACSSPAIGADGTIYIGSVDHNLYAVNPKGTQKWKFATAADVVSSPAIGADGTIYIGSGDNNLYAVNPDGTRKWAFTTGYVVYSSPTIGVDGTIYVGSGDNNFYAVNPDGSQKWKFATDSDVNSSPAIWRNGTIYDADREGNLFAVNPNLTMTCGTRPNTYTCPTQKWKFPIGFAAFSSPAIGADGTIYVGSGYVGHGGPDSQLYAINANGTQKWAFKIGSDEATSSPAIGADGTIYIGDEWLENHPDAGHLYAVNPDGTQKWAFATGGTVTSSPAIGADGAIYVGSNTNNGSYGYLYAIYPDGTQKWTFRTDGFVRSSPAIGADGTIYVGSQDGYLYAIGVGDRH